MADKVHFAQCRMGTIDVYTPKPDVIEWCDDCGVSLTKPDLFSRSGDKKGMKVGFRYIHCAKCLPLDLIACSNCGRTTTEGMDGMDGNFINSDGTAKCRGCVYVEAELEEAIAKVTQAGYRVVKNEASLVSN